ncbi:MAG: hypothetical protein U0V70_09640 [Terriglobia bacterium]
MFGKVWKQTGAGRDPEKTGHPLLPTYPTQVLKDFIKGISTMSNPRILDMGPAVGSNLEFFLNLGVKVYVEDFVTAYLNPKYSLVVDEKITLDENGFFQENFNYEIQSLDGLICWDYLCFIDPRFASAFVERISSMMKTGGLVMAFFHTHALKSPGAIHKYRIHNETALEYIPTEHKAEFKKAFQIRDVSQLFTGFQSQRSYLLKHNVIEILLKKK